MTNVEINLDYNAKDFQDKIINLPKEIKTVNITGNNIDISKLCDILEDVKENITIKSIYKNKIEQEFKRRNTYQGFNRSILNRVKKICEENITKSDIVVDMTIGNGHDTLYLAKLSKKVFGFDIQNIALNNTDKLLKENNVNNYELINISHDKIDSILKEYTYKIKLILFNLGYLPCGDKSITTRHDTTLKATKKSIDMITKDGLVLIVFYPHEEGKLESKEVLSYLERTKINYKIYRNTLNKDAPFLVVITKKEI